MPVTSNSKQSDQIIMRGLRKVYNPTTFSCQKKSETSGFVAVKSLSFGVPDGECFGLLGVNGAGKTTTFKMLTADLAPTEGGIFVRAKSGSHIDAANNNSQYWSQIGYCPQFDALYDELTPTEHMRLFARIKGVKKAHEDHLCECLLKRLDLVQYCNKPTGQLSLGNKRKLSAALALVGNPSIILLDEPTSGQDPVSRRRLWAEIINLTRREGRSVLLTSHSMEECEALCTRLAIMVDGQFKCMGSVQHLKSKFGEGYTLTVKIRERTISKHRATSSMTSVGDLERSPSRNKYIDTILSELREKISNKCRLKERNFNNVYQFELPCAGPADPFSIGDIYKLIEMNKLRFSIVDYSLTQNTLDNVFINFVKEQTNRKLQRRVDNDDSDRTTSDTDDSVNKRKANQFSSASIQFPIHDETDDMLLSLDDALDDSVELARSHHHHDPSSLVCFEPGEENPSGSQSSPQGFRASALSQTIASRFHLFRNESQAKSNANDVN
jgi:ABC-type multidrug transport system ATPase subunit